MQWNPTLLKKVQHRWFVFAYVFDTFSLIFPLFMSKSESLLSLFSPSLFFKERQKLFALFALYKKNRERIAPIAHYKRVNMSNSLPSLFTKNLHEQFSIFWEQIALSLTKMICSKKTKSEFLPCLCPGWITTEFFFIFFILKQTELGLGGHSYLNVCVAAPLYQLLKN